MERRKSVRMLMLVGINAVGLAFLASIGSMRATAQVKPYPHSDPSQPYGVNWKAAGLVGETRDATSQRLRAYKPDPVKYPAPRTKWDGKPDLSGVWWPGTFIGKPGVPLDAMYKDDPESKALRERTDFINWKNGYENPTFHCWPRSPLTASNGPNGDLQLVQAPGMLLMLDEEDHRFRIIPIDGGPHDPNAKASFMGDSVGRWEGDTLVVDVTMFNGKPWLEDQSGSLGGVGPQRGAPPRTSSDALHLVERWSRPDGQTLDYRVTVEDPKLLKAPWTSPIMRRGRMPFEIIQEALCMEDPDLAAREEAAAQLRERQGLPRNASDATRVLDDAARKKEAAKKKGTAK